MSPQEFQVLIWQFYNENKRSMPWRHSEPIGNFNPYKILVSELMLQQTQAERVIPKYVQFIEQFPSMQDLASATFSDVLRCWSGLGYNRRALYIHELAKQLHTRQFPRTIDELIEFRGVGANTAAAVLVYTYNLPLVFVETNVRTVYLHHFFASQKLVADKAILKKVTETLDSENAREFYWALMDYGTYLKKQGKNHLARSKSYSKQSRFDGSIRQVRGRVLKMLAINPTISKDKLQLDIADERFSDVLKQLEREGFIRVKNNLVSLVE